LNFLGNATLLVALGIQGQTNAHAVDPGTKPGTAAIPSPGTYKIDPDHTFAYFSAWHHVVGRVRGRFDKVTGTITVSPDAGDCAVEISIDTASISTQNAERDEDLRGPDFFDVKRFPAMTYRGRGIRRVSATQGGKTGWIMNGSLTIRGISRVVPLTFTFPGLVVTYPGSPNNPPGKPARPAFHASAAIKRGDFGMTRDNPMELGLPPAPGADVEIEIDVEADATAGTQ
jgi:polyisoprenoid-binding protein YceI